MEASTPQCNVRLRRDAALSDERTEKQRRRRFEREALAYIDDVHTFAHFLMRNPADAEDAVQETYLSALKYFDSFRGGSMKAWLFAILRNVCYAEAARRKRREAPMDVIAESDVISDALWHMPPETPEAALERQQTEATMVTLVGALPSPFREAVEQREFNELSYREIANAVGAPLGTVMSRLSRARALLRDMAEDVAA